MRGRIDVRQSLADISGHVDIQPPKSGRTRVVSIPQSLAARIGIHLDSYPSESGTVFSSPSGQLLRQSLWYRRFFKPAVVAAGLDPAIRFHDLRHTSVALAIEQGAHPKAIQDRLGHATVRLTLDRYGHSLPALDDQLRDGLETAYLAATAASSRPTVVNVDFPKREQRPA